MALSSILCFIIQQRTSLARGPFKVRGPIWQNPSNRPKTGPGSGLGSGSAKFIFSGLAPVQVFRPLILKVLFLLKLKILWIIWFKFGSGSQKQKFKGSNLVWVQELETVNSTYALVHSYVRICLKNTHCTEADCTFEEATVAHISNVLSGRNNLRLSLDALNCRYSYHNNQSSRKIFLKTHTI